MALTETMGTLLNQQKILENIREKIQEFPLSATTRGKLDRAHMEYSCVLSNVINELKAEKEPSLPASYMKFLPNNRLSLQINRGLVPAPAPVTGQTVLIPQKQQPKVFCVYCKATDHWSDSCAKFKTVVERTTILADQNRCFICTLPGHNKNACGFTKPCFHCKAIKCHHSSLCKSHVPCGVPAPKPKKAKGPPRKAAWGISSATANKRENQSVTNKRKPSAAQAQPTTAHSQGTQQVTVSLDMAQFIARQMKK